MVLACLKNVLFPAKKDGEYQRLLDAEHGPRQHSIDTNTTLNALNDEQNEKSSQGSLFTFHISPRVVSDATIGLSDGLTVPFALTAGLSALGTTDLVIYAGFAELVAGAISMGLGGYLGAKSEADAYLTTLQKTRNIVATDPQAACGMARSTFREYSLSRDSLDALTKDLQSEGRLVDFLMAFHHGLAEANFPSSKAYTAGLTIALGYFLGGLVPLLPYLFFERISEAFRCSIIIMGVALFAFGWLKTSVLGECSRWVCLQNAIQMLVLGAIAAGAAMGCVKAIGR
ncbi:hypothetical protein CBER1_05175 [Cercospora berteroae]|uniref:Uncharacterized protein n=1 Tax=Cercospora berteroae TaxID=357750 RepID=A0A2S6BRR5_9PEZI|nr:hypothetical protein CBER1_05175 [Cercospora berteroae]